MALDGQLAPNNFLVGTEPSIADLACYGDVAFAAMSGFEITRWRNITGWARRLTNLDGFALPLDLLPMADALIEYVWIICRDNSRKKRWPFRGPMSMPTFPLTDKLRMNIMAGAFGSISAPPPIMAVYLPSFRATCPDLVIAVSAFETLEQFSHQFGNG